jgi:hypothetical protein
MKVREGEERFGGGRRKGGREGSEIAAMFGYFLKKGVTEKHFRQLLRSNFFLEEIAQPRLTMDEEYVNGLVQRKYLWEENCWGIRN